MSLVVPSSWTPSDRGGGALEINQSLPHVQITLSRSKGVTPFIKKPNNLRQFYTKSVELLAQRAVETSTLPQEGTGVLAQRLWNHQGLASQLEHCVQTEEGQGGVWLSEGPPRCAGASCSGETSGSTGSPRGQPGRISAASLHPVPAWAGAGQLSKSISSRRSAMSTSPMTGRRKRSPSRLGGMDLRVEAVRRTRARRLWPAGHQGSRTSHSAWCASCCRCPMWEEAWRPGTSAGREGKDGW